MRYGRTFRALALVALIAAVGIGLPACGGGSGSDKKSSDDIFLKAMLLIDSLENTDIYTRGDPTYNDIGGDGTTNAFRDSKILFQFNTAVDFDTVSTRTIRVGIPTGNGLLVEATGRFEPVAKKPNWIVFNPTYRSAYDPEAPDQEPDNPFGFDGNAVYRVEIPSVGERAKVVTNDDGDPIVRSYTGGFATVDDYIQTYTQPEIVETNPLDGSVEVDATSDIDLTFSEPMKPSSFRLGDTVIVFNTDTNRPVLGTLRFSADAKTVTFRPVFGYGPGPYTIFVRVKTDVTNLAGNNPPREVTILFTTERDENVATLIDIREPFDDNDYEDKTFDTDQNFAAWNVGATSGYLAGLYGTGTINIKLSTGTFLYPPFSWGQNFPCRTHFIWTPTEVSTAPRTITGYSWYYRADTAAGTVTSVSINLAHHEPGSNGQNPVVTKFSSNFKDSPVGVVSNLASYTIPQNTATGSWLAGPTFTKTWNYNGKDNLLMEIYATNSANGQNNGTFNGLWGVNTTQGFNRVVFTLPNGLGGGAQAWPYGMDVRFNWLVASAEAQSLFYDTEVKSPTFLAALVDPAIADQPAGTTTALFFQGAPEDEANPGNPDHLMASEWLDDLTKISGYRWIRFNIYMTANQTTGQVPVYDSMTFPYYFFD